MKSENQAWKTLNTMGVKTRSKLCKWLINFKIYIYIYVCINKHFNKYIFKNQCSDISYVIEFCYSQCNRTYLIDFPLILMCAVTFQEKSDLACHVSTFYFMMGSFIYGYMGHHRSILQNIFRKHIGN